MYWPIICKVLIEEIMRLRANPAGVRPEDFAMITSSLDRIMGAMAHLSQTSPLMGALPFTAWTISHTDMSNQPQTWQRYSNCVPPPNVKEHTVLFYFHRGPS